MTKSIYIAATGQNDGKTTTSIGLMQAFIDRYEKVGFIKPVGQKYVTVGQEKIDKDAYLMNSIWPFDYPVKTASPIAIPGGYTEYYIKNRKEESVRITEKLLASYNAIKQGKDIVVIEGTGHAGVGSVFDLNNATVARMLGSKAIIVTTGGIGRPLDEVYLNKTLFEKEGVEILGVILNQVIEEKYEKVKDMVDKSLTHMGLKLLGAIPMQKTLSAPTMYQLIEHLDGELVNGDYLYGNIYDIIVGAMTAHNALVHIKKGTLLITPGDRSDLLLASIITNLFDKSHEKTGINKLAGIILTGNIRPHANVMNILRKTNIPVISVKQETYSTASKVYDLLVKIMPYDKQKIRLAQTLIPKYVDIDYIDQNL